MRSYYLSVILIFLLSCTPKKYQSEKINIITGILPIATLISNIGGKYVDVVAVIPPNSDPHSFNLSAADAVKIAQADLVVAIDQHIDGVLLTVEDNSNKILLNNNINSDVEGKKEVHQHQDGEEDHHHDDNNPHTWLSYEKSIELATKVKNILSQTLTNQEAYFNSNYNNFVDELNNAYQKDKSIIRNVVVIQKHNAWNYLLEELNIPVLGVLEEFEHQNVSFKKISNLVSLIHEQEKPVILIDDAFSGPTPVLQQIAKETGATVKILNPLMSQKKSSNIVDILQDNSSLLE